ncbi:TPA: relaxase/mobilization nuclease domain-containing protein [Staphylococcus aureus]
MATTKISSTKSTSRAINYAEKRAVVKGSHNCDIDFAKSAFKITREVYGKTGGNQGHVVIQSFKPDEVTPEQCNQLGLELAERIAPNHQVAVYTHDDTDHVHNHIVINSIDLETGKKFNNNKKALYDIRNASDEICKKHNLSVPERNASMRYTQAEKGLIEKGKSSWKDEIRDAIEQSQATNFEELERDLNQLDITIDRVTNKTITYRHLKENKKVRGKNLGEQFDKGALENEFAVANERREFEQQLSRHEPTETEHRFRDTETHFERPRKLRIKSREDDFELE